MNEPIVATVVETPRRKRPQLSGWVYFSEGYWKFTKIEPKMIEHRATFVIPAEGTSDSERMTEAKVREAAKQYVSDQYEKTGRVLHPEDYVAFAKSLNLIEVDK